LVVVVVVVVVTRSLPGGGFREVLQEWNYLERNHRRRPS